MSHEGTVLIDSLRTMSRSEPSPETHLLMEETENRPLSLCRIV